MHSALELASWFCRLRVAIFLNDVPSLCSALASRELALGASVGSARTWRETPLAPLVDLKSASIDVLKV